MNWIFEHIQLVIVLAVVVVTLVSKVLEALRTNKPTAGGTTLEDLFGPEEEDEPVERWPEPAAPVPPRNIATPPPLRQVILPAELGAMATEAERQHEMQERLRKIRAAKSPAAPAPAPVAAPMVVHRQTISGGLKGQLRSSKELRRAVILREILGPPVGLR